MGLFRKAMSVSTAGVIDFRSAKDRTASKSAAAARAGKATAREMKQQTAMMRTEIQSGTVEARLAKIDDLLAKNVVSQAEHTAARAQILGS